MKKSSKWLAALVGAGAVIGVAAAILLKEKDKDSSVESDDLFTEDDLDMDLEPVKEREYVPLKKTAAEASDTDAKEEPTEACEEPEAAEEPVETEITEEEPSEESTEEAEDNEEPSVEEADDKKTAE